VENIIREDFNVEALEIVELYCELLNARLGLIEQSRTVDPGIEDAVASIAYASSRVDIKELVMIRELLAAKYGAEYIKNAMDNVDGTVSPKLVHKLSVKAPARFLVEMYLKEISNAYNVGWRPEGEESEDEAGDEGGPSGGEKEKMLEPPIPADDAVNPTGSTGDSDGAAAANESGDSGQKGTATATAPNLPKESTASTASKPSALPSVPSAKPASKAAAGSSKAATAPANDGLPSIDELQKRFEALKRL
ncbi:Vacuolar protein sorting-associated protein ist1, partial [Linderina macrospora]